MAHSTPLAYASAMVRIILTALTLTCATAADALGQQADTPSRLPALADLERVTARTVVEWDREITMRGGTVESAFEADVLDAFESALLEAGVVLEDTLPARLDCVVSLTYGEDREGVVEFLRTVRLMEPRDEDDLRGAWVVRWSRGRVGSVPRRDLDGASIGRDCAEAFEGAWTPTGRGG